jgi:hypothetical protein
MIDTWQRTRLTIIRLAATSIAAVLLLAHVIVPVAVSAPKRPPLNVAIWDAATASDRVFAKPAKAKKPRWRTTFGSERRDRSKRGRTRFDIDADVVLIHGVRHIGALRRVFTSRKWRLILSPDFTRRAPRLGRLPADLRAYDIARHDTISAKPLTAIAVRYQRRVRVRGVKSMSALHYNSEGVKSEGDEAVSSSRSLAVRLFFKGRQVWVASVPVTAACKNQAEACIAGQRQQWRRRLKGPVLPLIAGLALVTDRDETDKTAQRLDCEASLFLLAKAGEPPQRLATTSRDSEGLGCLLTVAVP